MKLSSVYYVKREALASTRTTVATTMKIEEVLNWAGLYRLRLGKHPPPDLEESRRQRLRVLDHHLQTVTAGTCRKCGTSYEYVTRLEPEREALDESPTLCLTCFEWEEDAPARRKRLNAFEEQNPGAFFYLPQQGNPPRPAQYDMVQAWRPDKRIALVLVGDSFTGKTTAAYHLAKHLVSAPEQLINKFLAVNAGELNRIPELALERTLDEFLKSLLEPDLLLIDDLDKVRITPRVASELWTLFETRLRHTAVPIIITMNIRRRRDFIKLFPRGAPALVPEGLHAADGRLLGVPAQRLPPPLCVVRRALRVRVQGHVHRAGRDGGVPGRRGRGGGDGLAQAVLRGGGGAQAAEPDGDQAGA